jgi:hypothetical protein
VAVHPTRNKGISSPVWSLYHSVGPMLWGLQCVLPLCPQVMLLSLQCLYYSSILQKLFLMCLLSRVDSPSLCIVWLARHQRHLLWHISLCSYILWVGPDCWWWSSWLPRQCVFVWVLCFVLCRGCVCRGFVLCHWLVFVWWQSPRWWKSFRWVTGYLMLCLG